MNGTYLLLGSNLGNRLQNLKTAVQLLQQRNIRILNESSIYETEPWGIENQGWFLNVVLQIESGFNSSELLKVCLLVETEMGRVRLEKWGARLIDIDILYHQDEVVDNEQLKVPHPGIPTRRFTLLPLVELCPNDLHPVLARNQCELLAECTDMLDCKLTEFQL